MSWRSTSATCRWVKRLQPGAACNPGSRPLSARGHTTTTIAPTHALAHPPAEQGRAAAPHARAGRGAARGRAGAAALLCTHRGHAVPGLPRRSAGWVWVGEWVLGGGGWGQQRRPPPARLQLNYTCTCLAYRHMNHPLHPQAWCPTLRPSSACCSAPRMPPRARWSRACATCGAHSGARAAVLRVHARLAGWRWHQGPGVRPGGAACTLTRAHTAPSAGCPPHLTSQLCG